ncbi:hypothetical protein AVEN_215158-1 [Araneus ventricosus]|uniref:Uncharacterized protein n=1 Tax=Araneus ventricosus TaxID=182803 RepID=A0A4Y2RTL4_ARAVE|nr:hypothetical protein AVEN_215158-1 [Araneus ventricosus]
MDQFPMKVRHEDNLLPYTGIKIKLLSQMIPRCSNERFGQQKLSHLLLSQSFSHGLALHHVGLVNSNHFRNMALANKSKNSVSIRHTFGNAGENKTKTSTILFLYEKGNCYPKRTYKICKCRIN